MATEALKTTSITNMDSPTAVQAGMGGQGYMLTVNDHVASTAGVTTGSTYRMCRIPTNAKVKRVLFSCAAHATTGSFDVDVAHSDSTTDGTPAPLQGTIPQISAADNKLFGAALSATTALKNSDITFSGTFTTTHQNMELWNVLVALGTTSFSADPGGFFDILLKSTATDVTGGDLAIEVDYVC
ncbi:hypothetical protein [Bradyrhizobium sp. SZCCHNRI1073]|uniref:hypothetical protein n=1 Tax=Bradyrhizobium sp. SZCCHNRI1073 TaxID=3057280 RepID=UPI002915FA02|nr:hypothetical protein [Bradyrhizobium sp. SZCCHNRI1073]